jgi:tetrahydromethanopterin S-methyltransferase subunit C
MVTLLANLLGNLLEPLAAILALLLPVFWRSWFSVVAAVLFGFVWLAVLLNGYGFGAFLRADALIQVGVPLLLFAIVGRSVLHPLLLRRLT